jgi:hypothetical protein
MATATRNGDGGGGPDQDAFDAAQEMSEMGLEKAMAIIARFGRNTNRQTELQLAQERLAFDRANAEITKILREGRLDLQRQVQGNLQTERTARREGTSERFGILQENRESQQQYRRERDAQRQAYREQQDAERARRRQADDERRAAAGREGLSAPTVSTGGKGIVPSGGGWAPDKNAVAKFIIFATALAALGTIINGSSGKAPGTVQQINGVTIPAHLRSLGGSFIAGAIALVVNEVYPAAGAVLGAGIVGIIVIPTWAKVIPKIGALSFTGVPVSVGGGPGVSNLPGNPFAGPGGLQNPAVRWFQGSTAPGPFQGQSGQWEHKHYTSGNLDKMPPGDYWVWIPNG